MWRTAVPWWSHHNPKPAALTTSTGAGANDQPHSPAWPMWMLMTSRMVAESVATRQRAQGEPLGGLVGWSAAAGAGSGGWVGCAAGGCLGHGTTRLRTRDPWKGCLAL